MSKEEVEKKIWKALESVSDPETKISVVDLGLIYDVKYDPQARKAYIKMTLTSPFCPFAFYIVGNVRSAIMDLEEVDDVDIELVFDPPRSPERMSEKAKKLLGIEDRDFYDTPLGSVMVEIRIKVSSTNVRSLETALNIIKEEAKKTKLDISVVFLPTERLVIPTRKSPVGNGTATRDHRELRIHKRLVIVKGSMSGLSKFAKLAFRRRRPQDVNVRASFRGV